MSAPAHCPRRWAALDGRLVEGADDRGRARRGYVSTVARFPGGWAAYVPAGGGRGAWLAVEGCRVVPVAEQLGLPL